MDDTQTLMNGFMRMAVDNGVLSGNLVFEIDETNLVPGQDMSVYPGKVFRRQGGAPGQSLFGTKFPNVSQENLQLFDKARQLSDEATGMPSFAHGQTGVSGVGRTASGISMLMNAASGGVKTVIKNIDDYLLRPLGEAFFSFNMQFDYDPEAAGDLEVKARGTESLMANEVRSQRLLQFLQVVQNPTLAPFAKMPYIVREIAKSMDINPDEVIKTDKELQLEKFELAIGVATTSELQAKNEVDRVEGELTKSVKGKEADRDKKIKAEGEKVTQLLINIESEIKSEQQSNKKRKEEINSQKLLLARSALAFFE
jgi:hypothetical protein